MSRTEDRLTDALAAVARGVQEESLPPLPAHSPGSGLHRWGRWLAPAAAAASVALIVVLVSAIHLFAGPPGGAARSGGLPRYYATEESFQILIHSTATGAVVARVPSPRDAPAANFHGHVYMAAVSVVAVAGDREFIAAYTGTPPHSRALQTRLYEFHLTSAGHVAGLSLVEGGALVGMEASAAIAASPDGSQVALVIYHPTRETPQSQPAAVVVINTRTGARSVWAGGLHRRGLTFSIPSLSWGPGSRSLVFLAQWCKVPLGGGFCAPGPHAAQVRTLRLTGAASPGAPGGGPSGLLSDGRVLLSESARYPSIVQALLSPATPPSASPDPAAPPIAVTLVVLGGPYPDRRYPIPQDLRVVYVPLGGGGPQLLYHGVLGKQVAVFLGSGATGRYLLLTWPLHTWIDHGVLRPVSLQGG
jgi:hypothetical protein